jgi:THO complex subunit 1
LTFLSGVFPLGERSGVNLRGEYGPTWEGVKVVEKKKDESSTGEINDAVLEPKEIEVDADKMQVDEVKSGEGTKKPIASKLTDKDGASSPLITTFL